MFAIDDPTAVAAMPTPEAAGTPGFFTEGNPALGQAATYVRSSWLNALQQELLFILTAAGITPSKTAYNQILTAMRSNGLIYAIDTGAANACVTTFTPAVSALVDGMVLWFKAKATNTGATTLNVNGLGAAPVVGAAQVALQGGEIAANGKCQVIWNSAINAWVLIECTGAALQVGLATASGHALQFGQATGRLLRTTCFYRIAGVQNVSVDGGAPTTTGATSFTEISGAGKTFALIDGLGAGGGSGGNPTTTASQCAISGGAGGGSYGLRRDTSTLVGISVTVGLGGAAGVSGGNGSNGGASSFGALLTCPGGDGSAAGIAYAGVGNTGIANGGAAPTGANILALQGGKGGQAICSGVAFAACQQGGAAGNGNPQGFGAGAPGKYNGAGTASPQNGWPAPDGGSITVREYA